MDDNTQWLWLLAGIGTVLAAVVIYLWSIRARFQERPPKRRPRTGQQKEPRLGEPSAQGSTEEGDSHHFGDLEVITPDHHLADKALVDVEIYPIHRNDATVARSPFTEFSPRPDQDQLPTHETGYEPAHSKDESKHELKHELKHDLDLKDELKDHSKHDFNDFKRDDMRMERVGKIPSPASLLIRPAGESHPDTEPLLPDEMTVVLTVMAQPQQTFSGPAIQEAAEEAGFILGTSGLYERFPEANTPGEIAIISMGHLRKPGVFEPHAMANLITPGLLLFMRLPGPMGSMNALNLMVMAADQLARTLKGVISDERRVKITNQGLLALRNQVADWEESRLHFE